MESVKLTAAAVIVFEYVKPDPGFASNIIKTIMFDKKTIVNNRLYTEKKFHRNTR